MNEEQIHYAKIGDGEALFTCTPEDAPEVSAKLEAIMKKRGAKLMRDMRETKRQLVDAETLKSETKGGFLKR
jgi:hypothetical protein